jgi:UDP-2,3-diacylglucosamine pyrophosphatase LpxH
MNKTVILGDTHGRPHWKHIVASESPDRVIFIGDYFDSFDNTAVEQMHNFKEIIDWKQSGQSEVIMLIGNHDYHYMRGVSQYYSGYQSGARPAIEQLLYENRQHMQMAYGMGEFIFSHAGVSSDWLKIHGYDNESNLIDWINDMWKYKPNVFGFAGRDPYGDSKISSPIWIRPYSLQAANRDTLRDQFIQVVGHTTQGKIDTEGKSTGGRYYYIDTLGTSGQYMILEQTSMDNGEIKFNTYKR